MKPTLYIVIPCYNEEQVLPITSEMFLAKLQGLSDKGLIAENSRILFVDDGSKDKTWSIIQSLAKKDARFTGIRQSRNRGHQNAVLAGLMEAKDLCDITISIDCDGQDDIDAMDAMVEQYRNGCEIVYGVRSSRKTDTFFKRATAQGFYKLLGAMGVETVYNHADYRLVSSKVLQEFENYKEVNLFLRGMFPLVGFKSTSVYYERHERLAGESKYPLKKMLQLAFEGITSLSIRPLRMIMGLGCFIAALSFIGVIWSIVVAILGNAVPGWASMTCIICFIGGVQLACIGVLGEYVGKIYLEVKQRPRYIISERTTYEED
ncbi:MAG: glycosyltransferase family 2 protein [Oscillospiraceae bacterium]|nr:glycosyltransferase family 2 protein [Oscillospiraceae bacterium]